MSAPATARPKLLVVEAIHRRAREAVVVLSDGQRGRLPASHCRYDDYLQLAERSRKRRHPLGVAMGRDNQIVELVRADNDHVSKVVDHDRERARVLFQGHDGVFFLRKDHAEYGRIHGLLTQSVEAKRRIWFIARLPRLIIVDAVTVTP